VDVGRGRTKIIQDVQFDIGEVLVASRLTKLCPHKDTRRHILALRHSLMAVPNLMGSATEDDSQ
jgi:hypothetical protein